MQGDGPKKERTKLITPQVAKLEHTYKPGEVAVPTPTAGRHAVLLAGQRSSSPRVRSWMKHKTNLVIIIPYEPERKQNIFLISPSKVLNGRILRVNGKYTGLGAKRAVPIEA